MGLKDVQKKLDAERRKTAGQRLFSYVRQRSERLKNPLKVGDSFRASSLPYLCPREEVLAAKYDIIRVEHNHPRLQITLDIGVVFHDLYRDVYFGPMGEWVGAWRCKRCDWDTDVAGLSRPSKFRNGRAYQGKCVRMPEVCGGCGAPFIALSSSDNPFDMHGTFKEWHVEDKGIGLNGHPDGWSWRVGSKLVLVDLKSHSARDFSSRKKLRDGHDLQIWAYQHMCGNKKEPGEVWYLNKSPWGESSGFLRDIVKSFDKHEFDLYVVKPLEELHSGIAGGKIPERGCVSIDCSRAKECQLADVCFDS
jgi:hypothetical protein